MVRTSPSGLKTVSLQISRSLCLCVYMMFSLKNILNFFLDIFRVELVVILQH